MQAMLLFLIFCKGFFVTLLLGNDVAHDNGGEGGNIKDLTFGDGDRVKKDIEEIEVLDTEIHGTMHFNDGEEVRYSYWAKKEEEALPPPLKDVFKEYEERLAVYLESTNKLYDLPQDFTKKFLGVMQYVVFATVVENRTNLFVGVAPCERRVTLSTVPLHKIDPASAGEQSVSRAMMLLYKTVVDFMRSFDCITISVITDNYRDGDNPQFCLWTTTVLRL